MVLTVVESQGTRYLCYMAMGPKSMDAFHQQPGIRTQALTHSHIYLSIHICISTFLELYMYLKIHIDAHVQTYLYIFIFIYTLFWNDVYIILLVQVGVS